MKSTVLSHFYNEAFLLPHWLQHHKRVFDHGIMIDYQSTDASLDIIRKICPDWEIRSSRNTDFGAMNVDIEVEDIERGLEGYRMCLNVTEFLFGDMTTLPEEPTQLIIPAHMIVDDKFRTPGNNNIPGWEKAIWPLVPFGLIEGFDKGFTFKENFERAGRSLHNHPVSYPKPGRHYFTYNTEEFCIFHYGWAPMCEETLQRKLQIQNRIPEYDRTNRLGWHHITTREELIEKWRTKYLPGIHDLGWDRVKYLNKIVEMEGKKKAINISKE